MEAHQIPICALDGYLSAFFPSPPQDNLALKRFDSFFNPTGSFRVVLRTEEICIWNLLSLIRHQVRFKDFTVVFEVDTYCAAVGIADLVNGLLRNTHREWLRLIREGAISHIGTDGLSTHVVIKRTMVPPWMYAQYYIEVSDDYPAILGLKSLHTGSGKLTFMVGSDWT